MAEENRMTKNDTEARVKREIAEELKVMRDAISDVEHFSAATCDDGITNESDPDNCQRCYLEQALESVEKSAVAERVKNLELREAVQALLSEDALWRREYTAYLCFDNGLIKVCDSDAPRAFRVYREAVVWQFLTELLAKIKEPLRGRGAND